MLNTAILDDDKRFAKFLKGGVDVLRILQGEWKKEPYRRSEFVDRINKIIQKYGDNILNYRDIITYGKIMQMCENGWR